MGRRSGLWKPRYKSVRRRWEVVPSQRSRSRVIMTLVTCAAEVFNEGSTRPWIQVCVCERACENVCLNVACACVFVGVSARVFECVGVCEVRAVLGAACWFWDPHSPSAEHSQAWVLHSIGAQLLKVVGIRDAGNFPHSKCCCLFVPLVSRLSSSPIMFCDWVCLFACINIFLSLLFSVKYEG